MFDGNNIIANIRAVTQEKGLKQKHVAQCAGFSEKEYSALLNGRKTMKAEYIHVIAKALGTTPNRLYALPNDGHKNPAP